MRSKRLFALLLVFCLVLSNLSPMASAVEVGEDSVIKAQQKIENAEPTDKAGSPKDNSLLVSPDGAAQSVPTLRDNAVVKSEIETAENSNGSWQITPADAPNTSLLNPEVPACIEELKEVAKLYSADEVVTAFVVMEDQPLAETHSSPRLVSAAAEKAMIEKQDAVINSIEKNVLAGEKLEVRYQFTYLTNSFSMKTEFKNLEKIAYIPGVKSVFVMPVYNPCNTSTPNTAASGGMTGVHTVWEELGYTGTGMKIAIIDTGLDLDHPSFAADPALGETSMTAADIEAVLEDLNAYAVRKSITAADLYRSAKVPYAFNYVDASLRADHAMDGQGDHGTHVAGIAAANATAGTSVVGMAPDAQIIVMKVFGANGGAYADDIVAALEDAMTLGCDVVNASLGSPNGFASSETELDLIYQRLASQDIIATFSAGNEGTSSYGNMWGTDLNRTQNPDNATVGSPATWANTLAIASAENCEIHTPYFALSDGTKVHFAGTYQWALGETIGMNAIIGEELEYVMIDGLGAFEDYWDEEENSLVEGKVAVVSRGTLGFGEKIYNAELAGAVACVVVNNNDEIIYDFYMNVEVTDAEGNTFLPSIPACMIIQEDGEKMAAAETKTMTVSAETAPRVVEGGQMSTFSSWGVSPDLQLVPDITGIGGNVYSTVDGGNYGVMSGTSMSAPQMAGISALVMQHLYTIYPNVPDGTIRDLAEAILMSTAEPIIGSESGVEASPRQQGAGLVNAYAATTATTYLTVGGGRPKAELGDNANGVYKFTFEIHNIGDEDKTYTLDASLLTEDYAYAGNDLFFMYGMDMALEGSVTFDKDTVTVPAGGRANVAVTIALSDNDKYLFDVVWPNGGYVEGFVYLFNEEGAAELSLPYLGFYGDWTQAPVFDTAYWYDNSFFSMNPANGLPEGDQYYNVLWTDLGGQDWVLGLNPYSGPYTLDGVSIYYDSANNVISPNGDGVLDGISEMYLSLLRNAKTLTFTYTVEGEVVHEETILNNSKTMYISAYGQVVPWIYSWYGGGMYDFEGLPTGTEVLLTINATVDYGNGGNHTITIPITVDNQKPELLQVIEVPNETEDGTQYLIGAVVSDDISLASVVLMSASGTAIYDQAYDYHLQDLGNGTYLVAFDVTDLGTEFTIAVCDYACNEAYYKVTYTSAPDGNLPEMDTTQLYAYRVLDDHIMSDHMYGWVSMNKPESAEDYANISVWTDDYMEYAAINAAEFVGGKIFAVDAVYNLVVMDPGLWSRQTVCNLGVNVIDMTFDDSTDTMYVLSKQGSYTYLYSMDLLTGELTELASLGYYYYAPWAIADDDNGTLYAIKYNTANIFTLDVAGGTYAMTAVTDADGADVVITTSDGAAVTPSAYAQSITWIDGKLYWAYLYSPYYWSYATELICINTEDWSFFSVPYAAQAYDQNDELVDYYPSTELVGLLSLVPTDYVIPESTEASKLMLDKTDLIMQLGESVQLNASALPWNYKLSNVTWSSSDETIATVDETGFVSTVGAGTVTITAAYGDLTAECVINVVDITGSFNAYNYYSADGYYGYMINVDLVTMDYYLGNQSPIDFLAGDYNGHDGNFYGYAEGGQLYRYDLENNEVTALGAPVTGQPVDLAYDYSTGLMYMLTLDFNTAENKLYTVNMHSGAVHEEAVGFGILTLACDTEGNLYGVDLYGMFNQLMIADYSDYGMGVMIEAMPLLEEPLSEVYMLQSMCYDHNNDVFLWACCDATTVYWIDLKGETPVVVSLGDPTESGMFEFVGLYVIPEEIPELADTAVESVTAEDMLILTGNEKMPSVMIMPYNATCQDSVMTSSNTDVVAITENGMLKGVSAGTATITVSLNDTVGGQNYEVTFDVTVMDGADNMFAHLLTDVTTMDAQLWIELDPSMTSAYEPVAFFDYTIFTAEYYDGKIYTYGYDSYDWEANWQFFVLDADTYEIETQIDMGEAFPYVYDMTYDYATSTMYLLAGAAEDDTNLYVADMETGTAVLLMETDPLFMAIAAGPDGKLYAMEQSKEEITDEWDPWAQPTLTNATLWAIDPLAGTMEVVGDSGILSNMIGSMSYDYDTETMYWVSFAQTTAYVNHLSVVDLETGAATSLGTIGVAGAQVGGLYFVCDEFPAEDKSVLHNLLMATPKASVMVGDTTQLNALTIPMGADADFTWSSSDESIATVDANGVVTGIKQGKVTVTATATLNGVTKTATAAVAVLAADASFLSYNVTDKCWTNISRADTTVATNQGEPADYPEVITFTSKDNTVYGYDVNFQLFEMEPDTLIRTNIGAPIDIYAEEGYMFDIRDMAYDAANDRVLLLACNMLWNDYYEDYDEYQGETASGIYAVDLTTGELTLLQSITEQFRVFALTADAAGNAYYYAVFDDYITKMDLATGETTSLVTLQSQSIYGDMEYDYALYYDDLTGVLYLLFTSNGNFYKMHTIDATTGLFTQGDYVGEVIEEDQGGWSIYYGDDFNGLTFLKEAEPVYEADIVSASLSVNGTLNLNFYTVLSEDLAAAENVSMQFAVNGATETVALSDAVVKDGYYIFTVKLAARQMADEVGAQIMMGDEAIGEAKSYSIKKYAESKIANANSSEELVTLMKAMLNYGAAAQEFFGYNTENLANAGLADADKVLPAVDASAYKHSIEGFEEGIKAASASLEIASENTIRVYFKLTGDKTIDQYAFTVNGEEVTPVLRNGMYCVEIPGIVARDLDEMYAVSVGSLTVNYSGLSYANQVLNNAKSTQEKLDVATALYLYAMAAEEYWAEK